MNGIRRYAAIFAALCAITPQCSDILQKNSDTPTKLAPPAPSGLSAAYDTAQGCVLLSWNAVRGENIAGYGLYEPINPLRIRGD